MALLWYSSQGFLRDFVLLVKIRIDDAVVKGDILIYGNVVSHSDGSCCLFGVLICEGIHKRRILGQGCSLCV
jgi:hypothetical protein